MSKIRESIELGIDFWNDSSDLEHLQKAIEHGAVGATSNPVIVSQAIARQKDLWDEVLKNFLKEHPSASESDAAFYILKYAGQKASELLRPIYERSEGKKGKISLQVNPYLHRSASAMFEQGLQISDLAPNITIKVPSTGVGISTMEELSAQGVSINATVSFSISQAQASAEAIERGLEKARKNGKCLDSHTSYVTVMVGRVEDFLRKEVQEQNLSIDPRALLWSGIAVFKKARKLFQEKGYSAVLLAAAYRHQMHWTQLLGQGVVQSIPYKWWSSFDRSRVLLKETLDIPVAKDVLAELYQIPSFEKLMEEDAICKEDFGSMGPSVDTLSQFLSGQDHLQRWVRSHILGEA